MDEAQLTAALEDRVHNVDAGPPPFDAMKGRAVRVRRRRAVVGALAAIVVVAAAGGGVAAVVGDEPKTPVAAKDGADVPAPEPEQRLVGMGRLGVFVPNAWPTNAVDCGTPREDTIVLDVGLICMALVPFPDGVSMVDVRPARREETFESWRPVEVPGGVVLRGPDENFVDPVPDGVVVYVGRVALPDG